MSDIINQKELFNNPPLQGRETLFIIKIGGNIIDDENKLASFIQSFIAIQGNKILIHGGGKLATKLAKELNIEQQMIDGRRITDAETLKIVTMVYAGYINKNIVAKLQLHNCNAVGLSGADGNTIKAHKRSLKNGIDYGYVGDVDEVNTLFIQNLLQQKIAVVIAPITVDDKGQLLNTNADTIAQETAKAMSKLYNVTLIYSFEKAGVLLDVNNESTVIKSINPEFYSQLKKEKKIFEGMIPKLDNAFEALQSGVNKVIIGKAEELQNLIDGKSGTSIMQ
ncbi:MAG: acetylglutamate kinase [Bacteroidetes bacterium]|nr:acetylglutamate kinase [Bacteroidota bacterium]MBS1592219.1 acetylglutamate kinase [Bacteroidota bacterium]